MPRDKTATHLKVLAAAREEFMEYGYENASMRRIGQRCDMTAAGLYRHCKDKAGLFGEPVIHGYSEEEAYRCSEMLEEFFLPGWKQLLGF